MNSRTVIFEEYMDASARVLRAWIAFRDSHDLENEDFKCCDHTRELFAALQTLEDIISRARRETKAS